MNGGGGRATHFPVWSSSSASVVALPSPRVLQSFFNYVHLPDPGQPTLLQGACVDDKRGKKYDESDQDATTPAVGLALLLHASVGARMPVSVASNRTPLLRLGAVSARPLHLPAVSTPPLRLATVSAPPPHDLSLFGATSTSAATSASISTTSPSSVSTTTNAWQKLGAMPTEEAVQEYITIVQELFPNWDAGESAKRKDEDSISSASASKGPMGPVFSSLMYEEDEGNESELGDIHVSAREGATDDIVKLLAAGVVRDTEGRTPLDWAVDRGRLSAVEVLAKANADLNAKDNEGKQHSTALPFVKDKTLQHCSSSIMLIFRSRIKDEEGNTAQDLCPWNWYFMNQAN